MNIHFFYYDRALCLRLILKAGLCERETDRQYDKQAEFCNGRKISKKGERTDKKNNGDQEEREKGHH